MNRRRLLLLGLAIALIGGTITAWLVLARRDADFHVVGLKTRGVRATLAMLETTVDTADYQDCQTLQDVLHRLQRKWNERAQAGKLSEQDLVFDPWFFNRVSIDRDGFVLAGIKQDMGQCPIQLPAKSKTMPLKQFLRLTFAQTESKEVHFIVRAYRLEATTLERARDEQSRNLEGVSLYDRMQNLWKDMSGVADEDPTIFIID